MNIHPIFVHFPIALLTVYALFELLQFSLLLKKTYWWYLKGAFVVLGSVSSVASYMTGDWAAEAIDRSSEVQNLIQVHSGFAFGTVLIFGLISLSYVLLLLKKEGVAQWPVTRLAERLQQPNVIIPLSMIGLILVTVTGALGGAIVYGSEVDPIVSVIYHALIK